MANFKTKAKTGPTSPLVRPRPAEDGNFVAFHSEGDGFSAYFHQDVLEFIERESRRNEPDEAIGLLAGRTCYDLAHGPYTLVMAADGARADEVEASPSHVHISAFGNASVRQRLEASHPDREIVGWYHSHPRYPAQFSYVDIAEQSTWSDPHHVGIVFSGMEKNEPFGVYRGPTAVRLSRRSEDWRTSAEGQAIHDTERIAAERVPPARVVTERTQPVRSRLPVVVGTSTRRALVSRVLRGNLVRVVPRLLVVLAVFGFAAGIVWLHFRVRSIETVLGSERGIDSSSPTPAAPAETHLPEQSSRPTEAGAHSKATPEADARSANRTVLNDGPIAAPAANPLNGSTRRRNNTRSAKNKKPEARVKKNKKPEATNTKPAESRPDRQ